MSCSQKKIEKQSDIFKCPLSTLTFINMLLIIHKCTTHLICNEHSVETYYATSTTYLYLVLKVHARLIKPFITREDAQMHKLKLLAKFLIRCHNPIHLLLLSGIIRSEAKQVKNKAITCNTITRLQ